MLRLTHDQLDTVEQLGVRRRAALVDGLLAAAWPAVTGRLKDRWPAFVEAALLQAHRHGVDDTQDMANYASLWCIWGPGFEDKPGFDWAREIVADARRGASLKVHQLVQRTREELGRRPSAPAAPGAAPPITAAQIDGALRGIDAQMGQLGSARAIFPATGPRPVFKACDVAALDLMVAEPEGLMEYRPGPTGWQRGAVPRVEAAPLHWTHAPDEPHHFAVTSQALRAGPPARLNLKLQMIAACDPKLHPEVAHLGAQGRLAWKGRDTQRLSMALYALPPDPDAPQQGIAALTPADLQQLSVAACGQRDAGAPFGNGQVTVQVVSATQWLAELRHPAWPALAWPGGTAAAAFSPPSLRLESDGTTRNASAWQRGWAELPVKFRAGLEKLFNAWVRAVDPATPRLEVEAAPLVGEAAVTWGWRRTGPASVAMRAEGRIDLVACELDLRLSGDVVHAGSRARVTLSAKGRSELRTPIAQLGDTATTAGQELKSALRSFRFPFTLDVEPLAGPSLTTLSAGVMPEALAGAISGDCGLRPRPDGAGFCWFFALRCDASAVVLQAVDPVLGGTTLRRELLPAQTLVEWTAG